MKKYLVIGGSSGVGKSIVSMLLSAGNCVVATYNQTQIPEQHEQLQTLHLDVVKSALDISALPETLDGVVYCPGRIHLKPFLRVTVDELEADFALQVTGAFRILQQVIPFLKKNGNGSIVLFSTIAASRGFQFHSVVASSKGAIEGLTRALAAEFSPSIRVNCIAPSLTNTPLAARLLDTQEKVEQHAVRHPLKRIGNPEDIAATAVFLLGEQSGWITGQVLHVDGGLSFVS